MKVKCIDKECTNLTFGKKYEVIKTWEEKSRINPQDSYRVYLVIDDTGNESVEPICLFETMYKFMIKITLKQTNLSGFKWNNKKWYWLDCYVEVEGETLKDAIESLPEKYFDKSRYWIKADESYMKLEV